MGLEEEDDAAGGFVPRGSVRPLADCGVEVEFSANSDANFRLAFTRPTSSSLIRFIRAWEGGRGLISIICLRKHSRDNSRYPACK